MSKEKEADITALVIKDAAHDRRLAQARVDSIAGELQELQEAANQEFTPLAERVLEAEACLRAHERYQEHLPQGEWDKEQRRLLKVFDEAIQARDGIATKARSDAQPIQERLREASQRLQELEQEWRVHERTAKVARIDVKSLLGEE